LIIIPNKTGGHRVTSLIGIIPILVIYNKAVQNMNNPEKLRASKMKKATSKSGLFEKMKGLNLGK